MDFKDHQAGATNQHFWFKGKTDLITTLLQGLALKSHAKILDVGAGTGDDVTALANFGRVHALDIDQQALDLIPDYLVAEKRLGDACAMPYQDNFFDVVVAFDVLEHVQNDVQMVREIKRVLKPGGYFVFTVPAFNWLFSAHDYNLQHFRRYNKSMLDNILVGLTKERRGYWNSCLFLPAALQRLLSKGNEKSSESIFTPAKRINTMLYNVLRAENWMISKKIPLPIGLSIFGIYQLPDFEAKK